jgi:hypothetical protein
MAKKIGAAGIGTLQDELTTAWDSIQTYTSYEDGTASQDFERISAEFESAGLAGEGNIPPAPKLDEFVPGSVIETTGGLSFLWPPSYQEPDAKRSFGQLKVG